MLAASGWPKMPKTPHSSLNLSNMSFRPRCFERNTVRSPSTRRARPRRPARRSRLAPPTAMRSRLPPVCPITRAGTPRRRRALQHLAVTSRARPRRRRATPTRRTAPPRRSIAASRATLDAVDRHLGADAAGVEAALGERHRQAAVRAVVRRPDQPLVRPASRAAPAARARPSRSSAGGTPRTRPCTTFRYSLPPSSPRPSPSSTMTSPAAWKRRVDARGRRARAGRRRR